ncbi:MAG TPA: hypothetical protein VF656_10635 [Pyrinomonadaceae bacterium]
MSIEWTAQKASLRRAHAPTHSFARTSHESVGGARRPEQSYDATALSPAPLTSAFKVFPVFAVSDAPK